MIRLLVSSDSICSFPGWPSTMSRCFSKPWILVLLHLPQNVMPACCRMPMGPRALPAARGGMRIRMLHIGIRAGQIYRRCTNSWYSIKPSTKKRRQFTNSTMPCRAPELCSNTRTWRHSERPMLGTSIWLRTPSGCWIKQALKPRLCSGPTTATWPTARCMVEEGHWVTICAKNMVTIW